MAASVSSSAVSVAMKYVNTNDSELAAIAERVWGAAGISPSPTRGVKDYWRALAEDIAKDIRVQGTETILVTVGIAVDRVMDWAGSQGLPLADTLAVPLGVLAALVARRLIAGRRKDNPDKDNHDRT